MKHSELRHQPRHVNPRIQGEIEVNISINRTFYDNISFTQVLR